MSLLLAPLLLAAAAAPLPPAEAPRPAIVQRRIPFGAVAARRWRRTPRATTAGGPTG